MRRFIEGYKLFRKKYVLGEQAVMNELSKKGQQPEVMVVACCDSRVDPAVILQCDPGDLFVVRNVANIIPSFTDDDSHHGTCAALEFAITVLKVKHLVIMGHSQCGGVQALLSKALTSTHHFINNWVKTIDDPELAHIHDPDLYAQNALGISHKNALSFPWIKERLSNNSLQIHEWFFDIGEGKLLIRDRLKNEFVELTATADAM